MTKAAPRNHHIVPQFYLAGFTDTGMDDGTLYVYDYFQAKSYRASPKQACRERDYYRLEEPGVDPNELEGELSRVEGEIAPVLRAVIDRGKIAHGSEVGSLLSLAALIHARNRRGRHQLAEFLSGSLTSHLAERAIPREKWEKIRASQSRFGAGELPDYEEAVELAAANEWRAPAPQILLKTMISDAQRMLMESLLPRRWDLMRADPDDCGGFITSDSPLAWGDIGDSAASLTDEPIEITFPLAKSLALVSHVGAHSANCDAVPEIVAHINSRTHMMSTGLLFHPEPDFMLFRHRRFIDLASKYFDYVAEARRHGVERP
jgi:hypothetical protein